MGTLLRRRRAAYARVLPVLLLIVGLLLSGCPMTKHATKAGAQEEEPGPPSVLNPSLLDRG